MGVQVMSTMRGQAACPFHADADADGASAFLLGGGGEREEAMLFIFQVADVKRVNDLTTDLQMFAQKTMWIPLPGRHPPATAPHSPRSSSPVTASSSSPKTVGMHGGHLHGRVPATGNVNIDAYVIWA